MIPYLNERFGYNGDTVLEKERKKERAVATMMLEKERTVDDTGTWKRRVASSTSINESRGRDEHL